MLTAAPSRWEHGLTLLPLLPDGRRATAALLAAPGTAADAPLLLVGHGGAGHKLDENVNALAAVALQDARLRLLVVDGPVHGARRADPGAPRQQVLQDFDAAWRAGAPELAAPLADWHAALDALPQLGLAPARIAYWGLSMGTACGLPLLADLPKLDAAVLGMWSTGFPGSAHLPALAARVQAPVLFIGRMDDPLFAWGEQQELFRSLGSADKRLLALPGGHVPPDAATLAMALDWLRRTG